MSNFNYPKEAEKSIEEIQSLVNEGNFVDIYVFEEGDDDPFSEYNDIHKFEGMLYDSDNMEYNAIRSMIDDSVKNNIHWLDKCDDIINIEITYMPRISVHEVNMKKLSSMHKLTKNTLTKTMPVPYDMCRYTIYDLIDVIENLPIYAHIIITHDLSDIIKSSIGITDVKNIIDMFNPDIRKNIWLLSVTSNLDYFNMIDNSDITDYINAMCKASNLSASEIYTRIEESHLILHIYPGGIWINKCRGKNIGKLINFRFYSMEEK